MNPPRSSLCPGYKHVSAFSPSLSSPKSNSTLQVEIETDNLSSADAKAAEEDVDYEEEVEYVVLDLGNIEPTLVPSSSTYRLIVRLFFASWSSVWADEKSLQGLDTPTPFLQLSGTILKGRHDNLLGSELIFSDDKGLVLALVHNHVIDHELSMQTRLLHQMVRKSEVSLM